MALLKKSEQGEGDVDSIMKKSEKKRILEEDAYLESLKKIIQRDFYPDLEKLQIKREYLDALENDDIEKLREIELKIRRQFQSPSRVFSSNFDTPSTNMEDDYSSSSQTELIDNKSLSDSDVSGAKIMDDSDLSLDKFLHRNTSEDNVSFGKIMEEARIIRREKYSWLFDREKEQSNNLEQVLALPSPQNEHENAIENRPTNLDTWRYKPFNSLMYVPEGVPLDTNEQINNKSKKEQEICYKNTRFQENPFDINTRKAAMNEAARDNYVSRKKMGKVGVDGKLQTYSDSPKVQGFGFVTTPSPAPGVNESPLMTWGEIEDTPLRLDNPNATPGPTFKIPEPPKREVIGHQLVDRINKQHRDKRKEAYNKVTASFGSKTPRQFSVERLTHLSPVAQKLVKGSMRFISDKALRASYSPSPQRHTPTHDKPSAHRNTPRTKTSKKVTTPILGRIETSLTDNLLQLPKT